MTEPTYKEHKKLDEINEDFEQTGRHGNEDDIDMLYSLVRKGYLRALVSMGAYNWVFILTQKADDYLEEAKPK